MPVSAQTRLLPPLLAKAASAVREGGSRLLLMRVLHKLVSPLLKFGSITFFMRDLTEALPEPKPSVEVKLRLASPSDLPLLTELDDHARAPEVLRDRLRRGHLCFLATTLDGTLAHSQWVTAERAAIPELSMDIVPEPGTAYMYDGYTKLLLRGRGIDGVIRCHIFGILASLGFRAVHSYVQGDNFVGLRAANRWQQSLARILYFQVRGLKPLVLGSRRMRLATFVRSSDSEPDGTGKSSRASHRQAWLERWLSKRSAGSSAPSKSTPL